MKIGGGKGKGSSNERKLCKILSEWWTKKKKPVVFWRVGSSGAQFTLSRGSTKMSGDIVAIEEKGTDLIDTFSIEAKWHKDFDLLELLHPEKKSNKIESWWEQCTRDANAVDKIPLLIFRRNRSPFYYMTWKVIWSSIGCKLNEKPYIISNNRIVQELKFLIEIPPKEIKKWIKNYFKKGDSETQL